MFFSTYPLQRHRLPARVFFFPSDHSTTRRVRSPPEELYILNAHSFQYHLGMNRFLFCILLLALSGCATAPAPTAETITTLPAASATSAYIPNRAPLKPGALIKLPITSFRPTGWLGKSLELQRDGLTGHLGEISIWLTRKDNAWLRADGKGDFGWEEVPYWLRGYTRIAYILNDPRMLEESRFWIQSTLSSQRDSGDFGPIQLRRGKPDLWAQMLMLQVLQSYYEYSNDPRILPFMTRYFQWQLALPDEQFLKDYWENSRGGDNLASVHWLYNRTGDSFLLDLAAKIDRNTANWRQQDNLPNWHVVNIAECFREPAQFSLQSGKPADLGASYRNFTLARMRYGQVPGGMFGADENARPGHTDPHQAAETCSFVEQIASNLIMSEITGDPAWPENTEDVAFNTMPAAFTPDYRALRYLTAPNQAVSDSASHAPGIANDGPFFLMNPFSSRCCQHNHSSAWVNYTEHAWMATPDNGLAAVLFAPGVLTARVGSAVGLPAHILTSDSSNTATLLTQTHYPFDETITITVQDSPTGGFPLYLRIPTWTQDATVRINNRALDTPIKPGTYLRLAHTWKRGDHITLHFPMPIRIRTWEQNKSSISIDRGPLTYSLKIDEKYQPVQSDKHAIYDSGWQPGADASKWPSFEILPQSPWNYALVIDKRTPVASFKVIRNPWPADDQPFENSKAPIVLRASGRILADWILDKDGLAATLPQSPVQTSSPVTPITLVPMGGARLRISAFPVAAP